MAAGKSLFDPAEDLGGAASSRSSSGRSWHSPRISFSNDFAQLGGGGSGGGDGNGHDGDVERHHHQASSSGEFEFSSTTAAAGSAGNAAGVAAARAPLLSADELFYKGKLLPLHLPPRIRMVQDLDPSPPPAPPALPPPLKQDHGHGSMRRERSLRNPPRPSVVASTLKSSSYPPPGYSSRPSSPPRSGKYSSSSGSSSRWRDLFGFQKKTSSSASSSSSSSSSSVPSKLLKMIFNRSSSNSSSNSNAAEAATPPEIPAVVPDNALVPLLKDSPSNSCDPEILALHSSSVSSTSSSNWAASSANSSSSSMDLPMDEGSIRNSSRIKHDSSRGRGGLVSGRRSSSRIAGGGRYHGHIQSGSSTLQRSGSNRRRDGKIQLQDHVLIGGNSRHSGDTQWRRPMDHHSHHKSSSISSCSSSSMSACSSSNATVKVTPVLHVPACIGSVRVHGLRKLFSSSSSSNSSNNPGSKSNRSVAVM